MFKRILVLGAVIAIIRKILAIIAVSTAAGLLIMALVKVVEKK